VVHRAVLVGDGGLDPDAYRFDGGIVFFQFSEVGAGVHGLEKDGACREYRHDGLFQWALPEILYLVDSLSLSLGSRGPPVK
jgi:hypothetical protein